MMETSFFLSRRSLKASMHSGMPVWQDKLFIFLMRNAANPTDFYKIPPGRVVELGALVVHVQGEGVAVTDVGAEAVLTSVALCRGVDEAQAPGSDGGLRSSGRRGATDLSARSKQAPTR